MQFLDAICDLLESCVVQLVIELFHGQSLQYDDVKIVDKLQSLFCTKLMFGCGLESWDSAKCYIL